MTSKKNNANVSLIRYVANLNGYLDKAESGIPKQSPVLTPDDKRRSVKARKGGDRIVESIASLVKAHGLDSSSLDSGVMLQRLQAASTLEPV